MPHGQNVTFSRSMKQEDSPCSPLSSTSPSSCSSQPHSPALAHNFRSSCLEPANIDFNRLPDLDNTYIPEDCIDSNDLDQYLPGENAHLYQNNVYQGYKRGFDEDESNNNNHKNHKRSCGDGVLGMTESQEDALLTSSTSSGSFVRYHELQPSSSGAVKNERFLTAAPGSAATVYTYQSGVAMPPGGYYTNGGQYLPSYQYLPQRTGVFGNGTVGGYSGVDANAAETWGHYSM